MTLVSSGVGCLTNYTFLKIIVCALNILRQAHKKLEFSWTKV